MFLVEYLSMHAVYTVHRCSFPKCEQGSASSVRFLYDWPPLTYQLMMIFTWQWKTVVRYTNWRILHFDFEQEEEHEGCATKITPKLLFLFQTLISLCLSTADSENQYKQYFWFMPNNISDGHKSDCNTRVTCNCILSAFVIQEIKKIW